MQASNIDKDQHGYQQLYKIGFGDAGLQVGLSAFLWSLLTRPKLLYGAEIWSPNSETKMKELKQWQAQAAKKAFGKAAAATVIAEAAVGDLGWLSIKLQIIEAKLRIYGYLSRLPEKRLARQVFEHRRKTYIQTCVRANTPKLEDASCFSEAHTALEVVDLNPTIATAHFISIRYTKYEWKKLVRTKVEAFDKAELHQSVFRTESGIFYSTLKTKYGHEPYVFAHDRRSAMLKFYLRSRSFGLQARIHHGAANHSAKRWNYALLRQRRMRNTTSSHARHLLPNAKRLLATLSSNKKNPSIPRNCAIFELPPTMNWLPTFSVVLK
jgi:hypothetical protein